MGLMDSIKGLLGGAGGDHAGAGGGSDIMGMLTGFLGGQGDIGSKLGGLSGILDKFNASGMGDKVQSWLGKGENAPLSGDEVEQALGKDTIDEMAAKAGDAPDDMNTGLAGMLPGLVDKLTPDGNIPGADQIGGLLGNLDLGKMLGGFGK